MTGATIYGVKPNGDLQWYRHDGWQDGTALWTAGAGGKKVSGGWNIYSTVFSGGNGVIYGIKPNGDLQWYRHDGWQDGSATWTAGAGGKKVSGGWDIYSTVFSGGNGVIYGIKPNGDLQWYRHDGWQDGSATWTAGAGGNKVSGGWNIYSTVFSGGNGVIYGIKPNGDLQWYRHDGWQDGSATWTAGAGGKKVSGGWNIYSTVFSGGNGIIYGIKPNGDLQWYRHDGWQDGSATWTAGAGGNKVAGGWNIYSTVFSGYGASRVTDGAIYGIKPNGDLQWYRHDGWQNGTATWTAGAGGNKVSGGWNIYSTVFSGGNGIIYGIKANGDLQWYRHDGWQNGTATWTAGAGGNKVSGGWNIYSTVFSGGNGIIYGIKANGDLQWYRHDGWQNGTATWTAGAGGNKVSGGWNIYSTVFSGGNGIIYGIKANGDLQWYRHDGWQNGTATWTAGAGGNKVSGGWNIYSTVFSGGNGIIYGIKANGDLQWYRHDGWQNGTAQWTAGAGGKVSGGWNIYSTVFSGGNRALNVVVGAAPPSLSDFGHRSLRVGGTAASGSRRLVVVLAEFDNDAADAFPPFSATHPIEYYEKLAFGQQSAPFTTKDPINPASLTRYFQECSLNRFSISRYALIGPVAMGPLVGGLADEVMTKNYLAAAARNHVDAFIAADSDLDGTVESNELLVLVFSNIRAQMPCNRGNEPVDLNANEKINLRTAVAGPFTPFYQIAHELSHSLGTIDMYNSGAGNSMLTLMGGYSFYSDDQGTVHLDAWHKFALGWCEPRIQTLRGHGDVVVVGETSPSRPDGSVILWDPTRGSTEYFILERRSRTGVNRAYDSSVAGEGVLLWRITPGASPPVTHLGAPSGIVGGNSVWHDGQSIVPAWSDGTSTLTRLTFTSTTPDYQVRLGD